MMARCNGLRKGGEGRGGGGEGRGGEGRGGEGRENPSTCLRPRSQTNMVRE